MKSILTVAFLLLILGGCSDIVETRYEHDIVSVYFHERNDFSVGYMVGDEIRIKRIPPSAHVDIYADVNPEDSMWVECNHTRDRFDGSTTGGCIIHVRDVDDIGTGGWNHGKFGSGATTRID